MTEEEFSRCLNVDLFAAYWVNCFYKRNSNVCSVILVNSSNTSINDET